MHSSQPLFFPQVSCYLSHFFFLCSLSHVRGQYQSRSSTWKGLCVLCHVSRKSTIINPETVTLFIYINIDLFFPLRVDRWLFLFSAPLPFKQWEGSLCLTRLEDDFREILDNCLRLYTVCIAAVNLKLKLSVSGDFFWFFVFCFFGMAMLLLKN